jgi:hypothetical protein
MPFAITAALVLAGTLAADLPPGAADLSQPATLELEPPFQHKHHPWRAILETALAFGSNVLWYHWDPGLNAPDWELRWDAPSWKKKIITFEAVRFDSNHFSTNAGSHTEGGTLVYLIGRGNGLSVGSSTALALGEVIVWEYVAEYAEKPSINDMLNNPIGGLAVGEPFFQLSEFFARGADNGVNQTLAAIFSPLTPLNDWMDRRRRHPDGNNDRLGFTRDISHRFDLYSGISDAHFSEGGQRTETVLGLLTELNSVPGYGSASSRAGTFGAGRMTRLDGGLSLEGHGMSAALFSTRVALGGYHWQDLRRDDEGALHGNNLVAGLFNGFEYTGRSRPGFPYDQIASFGVVGPTVDLSHHAGFLQGELRLEALPDLAMVTSMAGDRYKQLFGSDGTKTPFAQRGYYYAYGLTLGSQLAVRYRLVAGGVDAHWDHFESVDVLDRYQERLTRNFHLVDGRLRSMAWLSVRPLASYADLGVALERTSRVGTIEDLHTSLVEHRATFRLALVF